MKRIRKIIMIMVLSILIPNFVKAGTINFGSSEKINNYQYKFYIKANDLDLNFIHGQFKISNGTISKITMSNGWMNQTGTNNDFYFYRNGSINGNYIVATVEVTMTGNSVYSASNVNFGKITCSADFYGHYYDTNGNIVSIPEYKKSCEKNTDATLTKLVPNVSNLSPAFSSIIDSYTLNVDSAVQSVGFQAVTNDSKSKVISGTNCFLNGPVTYCHIVVESEAGTRKTYTVQVIKNNEKITGITNFNVHNGQLTANFSENRTIYDLIPDKNASYLYFSLNIDGIPTTSKKCSTESITCELIVTINNQKRKYIFNIINEVQDSNSNNSTTIINGNNQVDSNSKTKENTKTVSKKKNTNNTQTKVDEETNSNSSVAEKEEENQKENDSEKTIDPIEYNKNKDKEEKNDSLKETTEIKEVEEKNNFKNIFWIIIGGILLLFILFKAIKIHKRNKPLRINVK